MTGAIGVSALRVSLGGAPVLLGVDLTVELGEWVTVIGPNGAGKSTLLRAVGGLLPHTGDVRLHGTPVGQVGRRELARLVATVPQTPTVRRTSSHWAVSQTATSRPLRRC